MSVTVFTSWAAGRSRSRGQLWRRSTPRSADWLIRLLCDVIAGCVRGLIGSCTVHTHTHTCIHTHAYIHTCIHTHTHIHTLHTHTHTRTHMQHTHTHTHAHTHIHTHTHTHTHARTHTRHRIYRDSHSSSSPRRPSGRHQSSPTTREQKTGQSAIPC